MRQPIALVGEAPARNGARFHLEGALARRCAGARPQSWGLAYMKRHGLVDILSFVMATRHVNLLDEWPGREGAGSAFPLDQARARAEYLKRCIAANGAGFDYPWNRVGAECEVILLAGKRVARAWGAKTGYFSWTSWQGWAPSPRNYQVAVVPHPSGLNRWWNDEQNRTRAREFVELLGLRYPWPRAPRSSE